MSNILIKNMELPKEGNVYLIIGEDGVVSKKIGSMYHVTTEAIEVTADRDTPMLIPKKDIHVDEFICPNCGEELTIYCRVWQRYCPMCGQRIYEASE